MELLTVKALAAGAVLVPVIDFLKDRMAWINGWRTWLMAAILSGVYTWFDSTVAAEPVPLPSSIMLGILIFVVAIGGNLVIARSSGGGKPTLTVNKPDGQ